jgi:hypothetical protein
VSEQNQESGEAGQPAGAGTPPAESAQSGDSQPRYSKAEMEAIVRERLAAEQRKHEAAAKKAADDAEAKKLQEQQEFQKLAAKHEERVKELEPTAQLAERYKVALTAQLETLRKDLPAHLIELLDPMDVAAQLEWLAKHQDVIRAAPPANGGGPPATPPAANSNETPEQRVARMAKKLVSSGAYDRL